MRITTIIIVIASVFLMISCGNDDATQQSSNQQNQNTDTGLTQFELEHGIGPVTEKVELDDIDPSMVENGRSIFQMKCEACHNMEGRMVGPALGEVMDRRSPEFVMNFMLNPSGMTQEHPIGKELLQEYMTPMPFQNITKDDARAIVEYLRDYSNN